MRIAMIGAALLAGACGGGNAEERDEGPTIQRNFPVGAFERIALEGSHDVIVTVGSAPSVRAEGRERALERLEVVVENGQLHIRSRRGSWLSFGSHGSATLHVTVPALSHAAVAGSGELTIDRVEGRSFDGFLAGSGDLDIGRMRVESANFDVAGSGHVRAAGTANRLDLSIAGSGGADFSGLQSRSAGATVHGSGNVRLHATETVDANLSGSGNITVTGGARCSVDKHGSGEVHCG